MRVKFYKSRNGWRWTIFAANGKKVANAGQGYSRRIDCIRGYEVVTGRFAASADPGWKVEGL